MNQSKRLFMQLSMVAYVIRRQIVDVNERLFHDLIGAMIHS